ncbi:MAG: hypothetical protein KC438_11135 [Thermomicrobiales bacterium]|nr:hypothetical protein [Thermomicrobiales bacterium]
MVESEVKKKAHDASELVSPETTGEFGELRHWPDRSGTGSGVVAVDGNQSI